MKFSALSVDFDSPSLDFFTFKETCALEHQRAYPCQSRYFTVVGQSFVKTAADHHGHAAYHNKH